MVFAVNIRNLHWALALVDKSKSKGYVLDSLHDSKPDNEKKGVDSVKEKISSSDIAKELWCTMSVKDISFTKQVVRLRHVLFRQLILRP